MPRSLRFRLVATILAVMVALAAFTTVEAIAARDRALRALHQSQIGFGASVGLQLSFALAGQRRLLAALLIGHPPGGPPAPCGPLFGRADLFSAEMAAIRVHRADGGLCTAVAPPDEARAPALLAMLAGASPDTATLGGVPYLILATAGTGDDAAASGRLAIDPRRLAALLRPPEAPADSAFAICDQIGTPLFTSRPDGVGTGWLPAGALPAVADGGRHVLQSRDGRSRIFVLARVAGTNLLLMTGFASAPEKALRRRFLALMLAPAAALLALCLACFRLMSVHPLHDRQAIRERALEAALAHNQYLTRELHHRIKNALQIVQSYIGFGKRESGEAAHRALLATETRINALSIAYRLALADGELKPVSLDSYLEAVTSNAATLLRLPDQSVETDLALGTAGHIDRLTPLGLIVVEALIAVFRQAKTVEVTIRGARDGQGHPLLSISARPAVHGIRVNRLFEGLMHQAEAEQLPPETGEVLLSLRLPREG